MLHERWRKKSSPQALPDPCRPGAALLTELAVLRFSGSDAETFLQGYLTCDTSTLTPDEARLTALTNLKGRVVASGWCLRREPGIIDWLIHASLTETVSAFLKPYLAFSRTGLSRRKGDFLVAGICTPDAPPAVTLIDTQDQLESLLRDHAVMAESHWRLACMAAGIALVSRSVSETFLPQMLGLVDAGAVDFRKGCYLGQEVVARAQHRGQVKRRLVHLTGDLPPLAPGTSLTDASGRDSGTVIDSVAGDTGQHCLAVVRLPPSESYQAAGMALRPV